MLTDQALLKTLISHCIVTKASEITTDSQRDVKRTLDNYDEEPFLQLAATEVYLCCLHLDVPLFGHVAALCAFVHVYCVSFNVLVYSMCDVMFIDFLFIIFFVNIQFSRHHRVD